MIKPRFDPNDYSDSDYRQYLAGYGFAYGRLLSACLGQLPPDAIWFADAKNGYAVVRPLPWDTAVLAVPTACLEYVFVARGSRSKREIYGRLLRQVVAWARRTKTRLLTARIAAGNIDLVQALEQHGFYTVDTLQTLAYVPPARPPAVPAGISGGRPADIARVSAIARGAFTSGRLHHDPRIVASRAGTFYQRLARHIAGHADYFTVIRGRGGVQGFCLGTIDAVGAAGGGKTVGVLWLVATAPAMRGRGVARRLLRHYLATMSRRVDLVEISTQVDNATALKIYQAAGARPAALITTLHGWIPR